MRATIKMPIETLALIIEAAYDELDDELDAMEAEEALSAAAGDETDLSDEEDLPEDDEEDDEAWENGEADDVELAEILDELSGEERAELQALVWVGSGEFGAEEWDRALARARTVSDREVVSNLLVMPDLGDTLESGLERLGFGDIGSDDEPPS